MQYNVQAKGQMFANEATLPWKYTHKRADTQTNTTVAHSNNNNNTISLYSNDSFIVHVLK